MHAAIINVADTRINLNIHSNMIKAEVVLANYTGLSPVDFGLIQHKAILDRDNIALISMMYFINLSMQEDYGDPELMI